MIHECDFIEDDYNFEIGVPSRVEYSSFKAMDPIFIRKDNPIPKRRRPKCAPCSFPQKRNKKGEGSLQTEIATRPAPSGGSQGVRVPRKERTPAIDLGALPSEPQNEVSRASSKKSKSTRQIILSEAPIEGIANMPDNIAKDSTEHSHKNGKASKATIDRSSEIMEEKNSPINEYFYSLGCDENIEQMDQLNEAIFSKMALDSMLGEPQNFELPSEKLNGKNGLYEGSKFLSVRVNNEKIDVYCRNREESDFLRYLFAVCDQDLRQEGIEELLESRKTVVQKSAKLCGAHACRGHSLTAAMPPRQHPHLAQSYGKLRRRLEATEKALLWQEYGKVKPSPNARGYFVSSNRSHHHHHHHHNH